MKQRFLIIFLLAVLLPIAAVAQGDWYTVIDNDWTFALGDASSKAADFGHGTEYFTYYAKVRSAGHDESPANPAFDDGGWQKVTLPHDWVVDLPFSGDASHSHGYKCIGWKYPRNSVGWYRRHFEIPSSDKGRQVWVEFEGIFRDSEVFCNGAYLGGEKSGYTSRVYDLSPYLNYGGDNVLTVRCDASVEEGWYYEGAGIYRHVRLLKAGPVAAKPYSIVVDGKSVKCDYSFASDSIDASKVSAVATFYDAEGREVESCEHPWSIEDPYLYSWRLQLLYDGKLSAEYNGRYGRRAARFDPKRGFLLNGETVELKGCNLHLDHAGVGAAVPDELWRYRLEQFKRYGFNAIRCSHNSASPSMLDLCDELGFVVIDENRQLGVNEEQLSQFRNMIERDRNHPSVVLWSIGNEEWSVEWTQTGRLIAEKMTAFAHSIDPTRLVTYGNCSGNVLLDGVELFGYNYIVQNDIEARHAQFPDRCVIGTEETSGAGTRGHYENVAAEGWMTPINRVDTLGRFNVIEHGWKFYKERPWAAGLFYWTGQDYRGEPNPMKWPATGSQFGILDYCCYPKDEAFYLQSVWTGDPMVHICGPYNGEVWVYSNCDNVRLSAGGHSLGTQAMPEDGHLVWKVGEAVTFKARGYVGGKIVAEASYPEVIGSTSVTVSKHTLRPDGQDLIVIDLISDEPSLEVSVENADLLGWGNGDPAFKDKERPLTGNSLTVRPFAGRVQILVRSIEGSSGTIYVHIGDNLLLTGCYCSEK